MSRDRAPGAGKSGIEVLEEAAHALRLAPPGTLLIFYAGSVPFVLGLLFFWFDLSRSAFAHRRAGPGALLLAALYLAMKVAHAAFARRLREALAGGPSGPPARAAFLRRAVAQAMLQPTGLFLLPLALLATVPFGWLYAFYQNLSVTGDRETARAQALLWPLQNHVLIAVGFLFGFVVFLDMALALLFLPGLLHSLLGIRTPVSDASWTLLNTTLLACAFGLTWLAVAPVLKAAYVVRCFDGDSRRTGEDLRVAIRRSFGSAGRAAVLLAAVAAATTPAAAGTPSPGAPAPPPEAARIEAADLEAALARVLERPRFAWRLPPAPRPEESQTIAGRFLDAVFDTMGGWWRPVRRAIERFTRWLERWVRRIAPEPPEIRDSAWPRAVRWLTAVLLAASAAGLALLAWRARRRRGAVAAVAEPAPALPDPGVDDSQAAATAPEDWLAIARDLTARGDTRLAARAAYLAMLSHLGGRGLLTLRRARSNQEYRRELQRRTRDRPQVAALFAENLLLFEPVWYGRRAATPDLVEALATRCEALRTHAQGY